MSGVGSGQGALYSPLPQSISDDSEEEVISVVQYNDNKKLVVSGNNSIDKKNGHTMGDYQPLGREIECEVTSNGFSSLSQGHRIADDVPIIKANQSISMHLRPMSLARKISFILSIVVCILTIIIFLWIIPCDWATCPAAPLKPSTKEWEQTLDRLELMGKVNVVHYTSRQFLLFLVRGDSILNNGSNSVVEGVEYFPPGTGGIISIVGETGQVAWWSKFHMMPRDMDCSLADLNADGINDCILVGLDGLLAVFQPVSGNKLWYLHSHDKNNDFHPVNLEFPLILPDLDKDGINDMLTFCNLLNDSKSSVSDHNYMLLISGKMGSLLGPPLKIQNCSKIISFMLETDWNVSINCENSAGTVSVLMISVTFMYEKITNKSLPFDLNKYKKPMIKQQSRQKNIGKSHFNIYEAGQCKLSVRNRGHCPGSCQTSIYLKEWKTDEELFSYSSDNVYTMVPVSLEFTSRAITGFVLKFWQWSNVGDMSSSNALFRNRLKKSVPFSMKDSNVYNISEHQLHETVVLITYNTTHVHIVNTSQTEVLQFCSTQNDLCQPDYKLQEQSLLVTDLNGDGSQELISYLTSFVRSSSGWQLQSKIRVIRLEAELPKLYDSIVH